MNRREFIRRIILATAMEGLATRTEATTAFISLGLWLDAAHQKVVFISDIHLSAERNTYWIDEHIGPMAKFFANAKCLKRYFGTHDPWRFP